MSVTDGLTIAFLLGGGALFLLGSLGLLRFPDVLCRLHALTKADNAGLGLIVLGVALHAGTWTAAAKLGLIWVLVMLASSTSAHLVARAALRDEAAKRVADGR